jgi:hypothetical protein
MEFGLLSLGGSNWSAYLSPTVEDISHVKVEVSTRGVDVADLRLRAAAVAIETLELSNGDRIVTYASADQSDVAKDERLATLAETLGDPTVQRATITVNGRHIELDFTIASASARTSGQPPLTDILGVGLPLLWPREDDERQRFVSMMKTARDQQTIDLFGAAGGAG